MDLSRIISWRMWALLLSDRILKRARLVKWGVGGVVAGWIGMRLSGLAARVWAREGRQWGRGGGLDGGEKWLVICVGWRRGLGSAPGISCRWECR